MRTGHGAWRARVRGQGRRRRGGRPYGGGRAPGRDGPRATGPARERTSQGSRTRTLILETALRLFQERGYDKTTMRAIAQEAGVSVGNAYYYYASKEHLIQGFYDRIAAEHAAAVTDVLARERDLAGRLRGVLLTWLDIAAPYHRFAAQFFKNAADPDSPLSPFSDASEGPREAAIALHRQVLAGADTKADPELAAALPACCGSSRWASSCTGCTTARKTANAAAAWSNGPRPWWPARWPPPGSGSCARWYAKSPTY